MPRTIMMLPGMMFPGRGVQYYQMGRELYRENPAFRQAMVRCDAIARGFEVAGTVDEVAPDIIGWRRGDRVMWPCCRSAVMRIPPCCNGEIHRVR